MTTLGPNLQKITPLSKTLDSIDLEFFDSVDTEKIGQFFNHMNSLDIQNFEYFVLKNPKFLDVFEGIGSYFSMNISNADQDYMSEHVSNDFSDFKYGISTSFDICQKLLDLLEKIDDGEFKQNTMQVLENTKGYWGDFVNYCYDDYKDKFQGTAPKGAKSEKYIDVINYYINNFNI